MTPVLGDSFPPNLKEDFALKNIKSQSVIYSFVPIAGKNKRFVLIGISNDKSEVAVLLFNTDKPFIGNKYLETLQEHFKSEDNPYLKWDSYLDCAHVITINYEILYKDLVNNPDHVLSPISQKDFDRVCAIAVNTKFISPKIVKRFGLAGYLLQK